MMPIRLLPLSLLLVATALPAQVKPTGGRTPGVLGAKSEAETQPPRGDGDVEVGDEPTGGKAGAVRERSMSPRGQCRFDLSMRPARLLPGQTGTLIVMMVLEADAVLPVPAKLSIEPAAPPPNMTLGPMQLRPPQPAGLAAAYRGQLVYDNYALIEIPVTMGTSAPLGSKQQAQLNARFELHEGATGRSLGEFAQSLGVVCEVGVSHDPLVQTGPQGASRPAVSAAAEAAAPADTDADESTRAEPGAAQSKVAQSQAAQSEETQSQEGQGQQLQPEVGRQPEPAGAGSAGEGGIAETSLFDAGDRGAPLSSYLLLGGGGVVTLLLLILLLRRR